MVSAALINNNLGGSAAGPSQVLYLGGANILKPVLGSYGVPLDSIEIEEQGFGGVSSMRFTIEDPAKAITLSAGQQVIFDDFTAGRRYFNGWLQAWSIERFGLGRKFTVQCTGVDALLDWMTVLPMTIPVHTEIPAAVQMIVANCIGPGVGLNASSSGFISTQANPVSGQIQPSGVNSTGEAITLDGETLREAIRKVLDVAVLLTTGNVPWDLVLRAIPTGYWIVTVDFYLGLRIALSVTSDWASLTVTDTTAGAIVAEDLEHEIDAGAIPRGVYVKGGNAAGTGVVMDGSGVPGPIARLDDASILTSDGYIAAGYGYLADKARPERGTFGVSDFAPSGEVHPGSQLVLTDAETGATGTYFIASIKRTFTGLRQSWTVAYGGLAPSFPKSVRRLTRTQRG